MSLVRVLLIVVAVVGPSQSVEAEVRRLILAAGANNGGVDRELLRYAVSDAEQFVEVLQEMGGLGSGRCVAVARSRLSCLRAGAGRSGPTGKGG